MGVPLCSAAAPVLQGRRAGSHCYSAAVLQGHIAGPQCLISCAAPQCYRAGEQRRSASYQLCRAAVQQCRSTTDPQSLLSAVQRPRATGPHSRAAVPLISCAAQFPGAGVFISLLISGVFSLECEGRHAGGRAAGGRALARGLVHGSPNSEATLGLIIHLSCAHKT